MVFQGRVEVYNLGIWEAVCSRDWDLKDANVVCRQLGFEGALTETKFAAFGRGTGSRWRYSVQCTGNESSLSECDHNGWRSYCFNDAAGVVCTPGNPSIHITHC